MKATKFSKGNFTLWLGFAVTLIGSLSYFLQFNPLARFFDPRQPGLYIVLGGLAMSVIGLGLGIRRAPINWRRNLGAPIFVSSLVLAGFYIANTFFVFQEEEIHFTNGEVKLAGTLMIPNGQGPHPAVILMHGSGPETRAGYRVNANYFIRQGLAVLNYDKRGAGASIGGHPRDSYEALARDALAGLAYLQSRPEIDTTQIGLWGQSEGGWTAPLAASLSDDVAFLIVISGGGVTPKEQGYFEDTSRSAGYVVDAFELIEGLSPEWHEADKSFDALPIIEQLDIPMLFIDGENDVLVPGKLNTARISNVLNAAGHKDFMVKVFPDATHGLMAAPSPCSICMPNDEIGPILPWYVSGYWETVTEWVTEHVAVNSEAADVVR